MLALALSLPLMLVGGMLLDALTHHDPQEPEHDPDPAPIQPIE